MKCPQCAAAAADAAAECPSCGLIFAKWRDRREKQSKEAAAVLERPPAPSAEPRQRAVLATIATGLAAAWVIFLAIYYHHALARIRSKAAAPPAAAPAAAP